MKKTRFWHGQISKRHENNTLVTSIEQLIQGYESRGFKIQTILGDGQFKHIQQIIEGKVIWRRTRSVSESVTIQISKA